MSKANNLIGRAVDRGYSTIKARPVLTLAIVVTLVFAGIYLPALILGIKQGFSSRKIEKTKDQAATEKTSASQEKIAAGELDAERKAEDQKRELEIKPQRDRAKGRLEEARRTRVALEKKYEQDLKTPRRPPVDDNDLRRRNCSDLAKVLPGQRVAGCQ